MSNDLHDSHAVGDDEPDHYAAFIAQKPELGWVYTDGNGNTCLVVADEDDPHLAFYDGGIRPAEVVAQRGPLTRARIVPADAIVLERPDAEAIAELENVLGGGPGRLDLRDEIGAVQGPSPASAHVRISPHLLDTPAELNPTDARTLAAHIATAADEAEQAHDTTTETHR